jgi:ubiquinone/menaquinone biosynthesis C-methylase UbiE
MKMNRLEKFIMNTPIRAFFQCRVEAPLLLRLGGSVVGLEVLEIGCGRGVGTELIFDLFGARRVHAVDVDPDMIARARRRLTRFSSDRLILETGDVTHLSLPNESVDAVFNFAILHHVPDWQAGVAEIRRVLKPGGRFFFEEVTRRALDRWSYRTFFDHPTENRFTASQFVTELERQRLRLAHPVIEKGGGDFLFGVAIRTP